MNKILLSILTIGVVGVVAVGASRAFFTDSETSSGNTFQTGTLDLVIGSQCTYNGVASSQCGTWTSGSLSNEKFFNFTDLKPGDWGENTITFDVTNDAWMCANLDITTNSDLGKYLNVFWWVDTNHDNKYQTGEKELYGGPRTIDGWLSLVGKTAGQTGALPLTFADSYLNWLTWPGSTPPNTTPIPKNSSQYLGVAWCFGTMTLNGDGNPGFTCSGVGDQADAQGDTIVGNLNFSVEQYRNNPNFLCPEHILPTPTQPV